MVEDYFTFGKYLVQLIQLKVDIISALFLALFLGSSPSFPDMILYVVIHNSTSLKLDTIIGLFPVRRDQLTAAYLNLAKLGDGRG